MQGSACPASSSPAWLPQWPSGQQPPHPPSSAGPGRHCHPPSTMEGFASRPMLAAHNIANLIASVQHGQRRMNENSNRGKLQAQW